MALDGPRLRRDLVSTIFEQDGVRCVDVHDPRRGSTFRLFGYEYSVALAFDGRPLAKVIPWVRLSTGLELTDEQLTAFAERLDQLGFLVSHMARTPGSAREVTPAPIGGTAEWAAVTRVPASSEPDAAQTAGPVNSEPETAPAPLPDTSEPFAVKTPVPIASEPVAAETAVPIASEPVAVQAPAPIPAEPVAVKKPARAWWRPAAAKKAVPIPSEPVAVKTPVPVRSEPAAAKTPVPIPSEPETVEPIASEPATAKTPVPIASEPAAAKTPVPIPSVSETAQDDAPAPPAALPEESLATESRPPTAEPTLPEAEAASSPTPSLDAPPASEPPAAVVTTSQPDGPSQAQPWLPAADATPAPVETPPPQADSPPVERQPDGPSQAQPWLPAADATPPPVETLAAQPISPPVETIAGQPASPPVETLAAQTVSPQSDEPSPVSLETLPTGVLREGPPPIPPEARTPPPVRELPPRGRISAGDATDGAGRRRVVRGSPRVLTPGPGRRLTPPPVRTPGVASAPLGSATGQGGPWILSALLGTVAALAVGAVVVPLAVRPHPPAAVRARVLVAKTTAVLRWFDASALVVTPPSQVLSFPAGGKVIRIASPGTLLRSGDVAAATDAARSALADLARLQERLAYFEQLAEGLRDTGDEKRVAAARARVELGAGLVGQTQAAVARVAVVAQSSGQIEATLASLGQTVRVGAPAVRLRSAGWRASFELPRPLVAQVRKQGFCAAEIEGKPVGCSLVPDGGDETHAVIELAPEAARVVGRAVRLARARFADAFVVPTSALSRVADSDRVLVVAPTGRAEARSVVVADRTAADAVVTQGLDVGDAVVVETSQPIGAGVRVQISEAMRE